ncbi:hypothetical protein CMK11_04160 [Candidatus Poribacteria bacterium]|nr:hypothetical protein [Candidatus Poribacteria bacterium]
MLLLADAAATEYVITLAREASAPENHAAAELSRLLGEISGAEFTITLPEDAGDAPRIAVGPEAAAEAGVAPQALEGLGDDGILMRVVGSNLALTGGDGAPRGTLYAVYTFLEEHLDCRWWSSKVRHIPKRVRVEIDDIDERFVPILEYRESFWYDAFDGDWAVRNKSNGNSVRTDEARGGHHTYKGFVHTFFPLVPPAEHFDAHPEWYSEIEGERKHDRAQLCLTNAELLAFTIGKVEEWLRESPEATIISVSQNDWHGACTCENCAAVDEEEGGHAGTMLRFVNAVAEAIEDEFPHVAVSTLAYQYTRKPPKLVKPRDNVIVRLCSIECNFAEPLTHDSNRTFRDDIVGWSKICDRLYIWDYTTDFRHYVQPHPNYYVLGDNIRFFVEHGVKGIFEQGAYQSYGSEMAEMRAWVLAKLLWDPYQDDHALIQEFLGGYFGRAAGHIDAHLRSVHASAKEVGKPIGCFAGQDAEFLTPDLLLESMRNLEAAAQAVVGSEELSARVAVATLPVWYVSLLRWDEVRARADETGQAWLMPDDKAAAIDAFEEIWTAKEMTLLAEWGERNIAWLRSEVLGE